MDMTFTVHRDGFTDHHGEEIKPIDKTFISPLISGGISAGLNSYCWVLYQNWFGRWQIKEEIVCAVWYSNIWGYRLSNGWNICADELGKTLFLRDQLQQAKETCIEKNRMQKVKVKYLN